MIVLLNGSKKLELKLLLELKGKTNFYMLAQFSYGISSTVAPKMQDFLPKIYLLKGSYCIL
jgi:hypothetical protein